jgi:hypothetical protein
MHFKRLICLLLLLIANRASGAIIDGIAAIVNTDVITKSEVYFADKLKLDISGLPPRPDMLSRRVDHHLVLQQVVKQPPLAISDEDVRVAVETFSSGHGEKDDFLLYLNSIGMNYADFEKEVREQLTIRKFIGERFRPFVNITLEQAEKYYNEVYKPNKEKAGQQAPPFAESFTEIQNLLVEAQVQDRIKKWLDDIRQTALINLKE